MLPSWTFLLAGASLALGWWIGSPWPPALAALWLAVDAVSAIRADRHTASLNRLAAPPPLNTVLRFTVRVTDAAWDALQLTGDERDALKRDPARPAGFVAEQWSRCLTRWRIFTLNSTASERVVDFYDNDPGPSDWPLSLWSSAPVEFRLEHQRELLFFAKHPNDSVMPDASVYNPSRVLGSTGFRVGRDRGRHSGSRWPS